MKHEITIEAAIAGEGSLLCRIADALRSAPLPPECLVWTTMQDSNEARIWLTFTMTEAELPDLLDRLRALQGVRMVVPLGPGSVSIGSLGMPKSKAT